MKKLLLSLNLLMMTICGQAQTAQMVLDILPGKGSSNPNNFTAYKAKLYFFASDSVHGTELWSYDGTNPPAMEFDLNPGIVNGVAVIPAYFAFVIQGIFQGPDDNFMAVYNDKLYFLGNNGATGAELYVYDGTNPPVIAADILQGPAGSSPHGLTVIGSKLYFAAASANSGVELYSYDGINQPILTDVFPGSGSSYPAFFTAYNGKIYFAAEDSTYGRELWALDTATSMVSRIADIDTGYYQLHWDDTAMAARSSRPCYFSVANGKLYFLGAFREALYSYDGATLSQLTGTQSANPAVTVTSYTFYGNDVYLSAALNNYNYQLYKYNIGLGNMSIVSPIGTNFFYNSTPGYFTPYKNKLYFGAFAWPSAYELWATDGANTNLVADIGPGKFQGYPHNLFVWNNVLYFSANDSVHGNELFRLNDATSVPQLYCKGGSASIYPNPAKDVLYLTINWEEAQSLSATITDMAGRIYTTFFAPSSKEYSATVSLQHLPAGNYMLSIRGSKAGLIQRVITVKP